MTETSDPRTPAEAKRHWMIDRLWAIWLFSFVACSFLIGLVWNGLWPEALAGRRLDILGWALAGFLFQQLAIGVYFALGGPVGRWHARWGNRSILAEDDETAARRAYDGDMP